MGRRHPRRNRGGVVVGFGQGFDPRRVAASLIGARAFVGAHPIAAALGFAALYVAFAALSLPGAWTMSVAGGALFGPWLGVLLVSLSSTAGATVAMLAARYLFRDAVAERFPAFVERVDKGVKSDGARWLFAARLTPVIPFFAINLAIGLTRMPARVFALVTLLGALPIVVIYVFAGQAFATIEHPGDVLSGRVLVALSALALAPFVAKALGGWRASRAKLDVWPRPRGFDYNVIVVGAGSAGLVTAYVAAAARARVALIEERAMGGECLNTGCVPSKALAAIAAQRGLKAPDFATKGLYYLGGLTEGAETIALFVAMCLWPAAFPGLAYAFAVLCLATTLTRWRWGWEAFAPAEPETRDAPLPGGDLNEAMVARR